MTVENIPWMIHNGIHSAASGRRALYQATGGAEGVSGFRALRVRTNNPNGLSVLVDPGAAIMVNRYAGATEEAYQGIVTEQHVVPLAANGGGSTRYDLIIARVDDWNAAGGQVLPQGTALPTDDVAAFRLEVIQGVSSSVKTAKELNLGYPAIALARVAIGAGQASVSSIANLRKVAQPRRQRDVYTYVLVDPESYTVLGSSAEWIPPASQNLDVPEWATKLKVIAHIVGVTDNGGGGQGNLRARFGGNLLENQQVLLEATSRSTISLGDEFDVPAAMRGTTQELMLWANRSVGNVHVDKYSSVIWDVEFLETAVTD